MKQSIRLVIEMANQLLESFGAQNLYSVGWASLCSKSEVMLRYMLYGRSCNNFSKAAQSYSRRRRRVQLRVLELKRFILISNRHVGLKRCCMVYNKLLCVGGKILLEKSIQGRILFEGIWFYTILPSVRFKG